MTKVQMRAWKINKRGVVQKLTVVAVTVGVEMELI